MCPEKTVIFVQKEKDSNVTHKISKSSPERQREFPEYSYGCLEVQ